jgi:hypothetical protein
MLQIALLKFSNKNKVMVIIIIPHGAIQKVFLPNIDLGTKANFCHLIIINNKSLQEFLFAHKAL